MVLLGEGGLAVADASCPLQLNSPKAGWNEQNPDHWWDATLTAAAALRAKVPSVWDAVQAIGLSGQMHGAVLLDAHKRPLRDAILWNDGRSVDECTQLSATMPEIGDRSGAIAMPGFTAPKLLWVQKHEPEIYKKIAHVLLPKDYVRLKLAGTLATDMADAAGTMWLDQRARAWSGKQCEASGTGQNWLPKTFEGTEVSGYLTKVPAAELGLKAGIAIAAGAGDAAAGAMGIGAVNNGDCFISLGTSGQLFVVTDTYRPNPNSAVHAYAHCVPKQWFQMAVMLNGASPMSWFAPIAGANIGTLLEEAQNEDPTQTPLFLPYLTGERTPHNDAEIRGCFYGLNPSTNRGQMMRGVADAIAYSFCDARDALSSAGSTIENPAAIGGGAQSDFVLQNMSDAMGISITRYADAETGPALGAARLAAIACGAMDLASAAQVPDTDKVFVPNPAKVDFHKERLEQYRGLYAALKPFASAT